jgi:hypothetical protein
LNRTKSEWVTRVDHAKRRFALRHGFDKLTTGYGSKGEGLADHSESKWRWPFAWALEGWSGQIGVDRTESEGFALRH